MLVPPDLSAGVQGVQVIHLTMDNQGQQQQIESNVAAFVLHRQITDAIAQGDWGMRRMRGTRGTRGTRETNDN